MASQAQPLIARASCQILAPVLASLLMYATVSHSEQYAAEVYSDDQVRVYSGLGDNGASVLQFGDVVELTVAVEFDATKIRVPELDEQFFESAWSPGSGVLLQDVELTRGRGRSDRADAIQAKYRFQVLACPDEEATCPGTRRYVIPEFKLHYLAVGRQPDEPPVVVNFRIWPESLTVLTSIMRDAENQLLPFETYFPNGAYPEPLVVQDSSGAWWVTAGTALAIFAGGMLMWPFGNRQKNNSMSVPRWQSLLQDLGRDVDQDEARLIDNLRRCLVWYCNDALRIDPFTWLDLAETGDQSATETNHSELRSLFVLLLHNPVGRGDELKTQLQQLIGGPTAA
ncbi:MAG: hypothetical protein HKN77_04425 [Woeseiaceae bacterium]|nr:hypothetical protein [Woeseiaceae bacterium]